MENSGLISVIIPVYNVEAYLRECVDSVLSQTYQDFEIILVDDGSIDGSPAICDEYAKRDGRITVIHQANKGQAAARNEGLKNAAGQYIYFLDSDDWIELTAFEQLYAIAEKENADLVFFDAESFDDETGQKSKRQSYIRVNDYPSGFGRDVFEMMQERHEFSNAIPLTFLRSSFLREKQLSYVPGITMEDVLFSFQLFCAACRVVQLKQVLYHRRYHAGSVTKTPRTPKHFYSGCVLCNQLQMFVENNGLEGTASDRYIARCASNTLNMYSDMNAKERKEWKSDYSKLRKNILDNNGFGQKALVARCYGKLPWIIVKVWQKVFGQ